MSTIEVTTNLQDIMQQLAAARAEMAERLESVHVAIREAQVEIAGLRAQRDGIQAELLRMDHALHGPQKRKRRAKTEVKE